MDPHAFHEFERTGWERASAHYDAAFVSLTRQTAHSLLEATGVTAGTQLLDVASGPGPIAAEAAARGARVTGLDFSASMVAEARRRYPRIDFREGDAEALPFDSATFDAVVMNFGLLHLARPEAAIAEAHRVLRAGGRYALTVWAPPEEAVGFGMALRAIQTHGNPDVPLPEGPPFFQFSTEGAFRRVLERFGFSDVNVRTLRLQWRVAESDDVFEALSHGGVRTSAVLRGQTPEALAAIKLELREGVNAYASDGGFVLPMPAVLASAAKPA